jgi:hypothetical protein
MHSTSISPNLTVQTRILRLGCDVLCRPNPQGFQYLSSRIKGQAVPQIWRIRLWTSLYHESIGRVWNSSSSCVKHLSSCINSLPSRKPNPLTASQVRRTTTCSLTDQIAVDPQLLYRCGYLGARIVFSVRHLYAFHVRKSSGVLHSCRLWAFGQFGHSIRRFGSLKQVKDDTHHW